MGITKRILISLLVVLIALAGIYFSIRPSNDRNWNKDQQLLSYAVVDGDLVHLYNIRNMTYRTTSDFDVSHYNKTFNISELFEVHFMVEPFSAILGAAHTFVTFGFNHTDYVVISVEIRKEVGEHFSAVKGLLRQYELMYVVGDERDLIKLRSNYRNDTVFLYPVNTTMEKKKALFLDMISRVNKLKEKPEFYNTLTSTCTTNIVSHINKITPKKVPFSFKVLMPANSDQLAYDLDLIEKKGTLNETREYYRINDLALKYADDPEFSLRIRKR